MEYNAKLKNRMAKYAVLLVFGVLFVILSAVKVLNDEFFISYGIALCIISIVNIVKYRKILLSEKLTKQQMINETDERNIFVWKEARAAAFNISVFLMGVGVVVLYFVNLKREASVICYVMCVQVLVYYIVCRYLQRKL